MPQTENGPNKRLQQTPKNGAADASRYA